MICRAQSMSSLIETIQEVCIGGVGLMLRVQKWSPDGEEIAIEYRWRSYPNGKAVEIPMDSLEAMPTGRAESRRV